MGRSGYTDDYDDDGRLNCWRSAVASAIRGKRGQAFLREMLAALDTLPAPRLIAGDLIADGEVCAIGSVGVRRGLDMSELDPEDYEKIAAMFGVARAFVQEIEYMNDEAHWEAVETSEQRFARVRQWVTEQLLPEKP